VTLYSNETLTSGVRLAPGSGAWDNLSDRNAKTDFAALDEDAILAKVASLPVGEWRYKSESGVRHVGPMAQDFYATFGVGDDDHHIASIDEDGVALAAIKALNRDNTTLHRENGRLFRENESMRRDNSELRDRLDAIAASEAILAHQVDVLSHHRY